MMIINTVLTTVIIFTVSFRGCALANATCREVLKSASPQTNELWVDTDTKDCVRKICRQDYISCLGSRGFPEPYGGPNSAAPPALDDMVVVFSDEFNSRYRDFRPGKDAKWQALDLMYVNDDAAMFRSSAVKVRDGTAIITASRTKSTGPYSAPWGDLETEAKYTSGMLQGWNKFCFTGGYLEARLKLPGDDVHGGLWPAVFTLGNLGRAGYLRSTDGVWPFSYDTCDQAALVQQNWTDHHGQRINRCNSTAALGMKGRGAPEIDLLEVGVWQSNKPQLSTSMHVAPILPLGLHWLDQKEGTYFPTYSDPTLYSAPNGWWGVNSFMRNGVGVPRPGTRLADAMSATHSLNASHFNSFYVYGFDWAPGRYIRWYINGKLIYELNAKALKGGTNGNNDTVGDRLIPLEPQYININVAMSNSFAQISDDLPLPASMEVDYIRVYQPRSEVNIGCDTPDFPSQDYINANADRYRINLPGYEDFVGDSRVMGPTMEPPPPDHTKTIVLAVVIPVGCLLLLGAGLGYWLWRRRQRAREAADPEAAKQRQLVELAAQQEAELGQRRWGLRLLLTLCYGSPAANTRHALAARRPIQVAPAPPPRPVTAG